MLPTIATGNVGSALAGEYEVANSLRFDDGSSDYLTRSQINSAGNNNFYMHLFGLKENSFGKHNSFSLNDLVLLIILL